MGSEHLHNPKVLFTVGHDTFEGTAPIVDPDKESNSAAEVLKLMETKYGWDYGLIVELIPQ
ncbi:MAG: hypothetical protein ICV56_00105 [Nitrososphaeraceae archaeon]|nr:hypothetical protein [Nitrososphaeraceae archaeon]